MKGENLKRLRTILDKQFSPAVLNARILLGGRRNEAIVRDSMRTMLAQARELLVATNQCRHTRNPVMRVLVEDVRREAVLFCAIAATADGTLPFVSKEASSGYNEQSLKHYGEMLAALDCLVALQ
jgi:hypothetical protein